MVVATRVLVPDRTWTTRLDRREPPPCEGSSSVRVRLFLSREYSSRRLAGGGHARTDHRDKCAGNGDQIFYVYDPALFLSYEATRRAVHGMLASMPLLRGVDISTDNWASCSALDAAATSMRDRARKDDDAGLGGGRYHFSLELAMEVTLVYIEPKAVVRACAETVMQVAEPASADHQCTICMDGFDNIGAGPTAPVNLPCSHPFHTHCITVWLFKGHSCPVCRHDLRGLVSAPWASQARKLGLKY
ncbi:hypothetical protein SEVIR_5G190900v4 [Setaria viridis]|uniref:RING-type domain-containing protein n=1 Tax=Setaria viridis TaxID=4556 RepID=A0A4U6UIG5_SETVI|nr:uncharacterized protein LOC117856329 [Setaria viridis]TKW14795.1 hypothetical protein SEVIR_5G190900v2 [Setaria viridis]